MGLKCGIVGLPNVGKSTLFNAISSGKALAANYPFATKDPNMGMVTVPDERLDKLVELVEPKNVVPTTVEIVDIAGLIKGASKGEGLGNQFLADIRETDAILHVVRCFEDPNVVHVDGSVDPVRDKEVIDIELQLKDLETVEKAYQKAQRNAKSMEKSAIKALEILTILKETLEKGDSVRAAQVAEEDKPFVKDMNLLTSKPILYVCNVDEMSAKDGNEHVARLKEAIKDEEAEVMIISAAIEEDISDLESVEERMEFLAEMGLERSGTENLIQSAYALLNLITYFTAGVKEVRAWTVKNGSKAPQAAGVIHTDIERGFIRAEVIKYDDFVTLGSEQAVKEAGKMNVEGKEYVVLDGDIMHFRHNS